MRYSLLMVGAHDGQKTEELVDLCCTYGPVLLIEAVPWIFEKLTHFHRHRPQVRLLNEAISPINGEIEFFMLPEEALAMNEAGTQMGSIIKTHATDHDPKLKPLLRSITCPSRTFSKLISDLGITEIDLLVTDMEGADVKSLLDFPFALVRPCQILFEAKHADGCMHLGQNMATLLLILHAHDYRVMVTGSENFLAVDTRADPARARVNIKI